MKVTSLLSLVATAALVSAGDFIPTGQLPASDIVPGAFIIQFQDGVDYSKSGIFLNVKIGLSFDVRHQYSIFNGISIQLKSDHTGDELAKLEGVKNVWPVQIAQLPEPRSSNNDNDLAQPALTTAHKMTGVDFVHEAFKYTGKGIKVAIVDTGIDYRHPALGKCFGQGCRVEFGWDFIGDTFGANRTLAPDADPNDCNSHGTHVAGIVGADARDVGAPQPFVGVAPEVTFGAYKVLSCNGRGPTDVILKGMERAAEDKMDIINLSLGIGSDYRSNPFAILADQLTAKGIVVVGAAGNTGDEGIWSVAEVGLGAFSTSVASFDNIRGDYYYFTYNGTEYPYLFSDTWAKPLDLPPSATLIPVLRSDGSLADGCTDESYAGYNVTGKIVLIYGDISTCKSEERGTVAQRAGIAGMLVQSTPPGLNGLVGKTDFPMASIEERMGAGLIAAYQANPDNTFQWSATKKPFVMGFLGVPSDFSSWGFDGDLHIKPEIAAPGGNILSTIPLNMGNYSVESGTSMATPYVSGAYALLFSMTGVLPAQDARRRFINSAVPGRFFNDTKLAPVAKQGGGLINVENAFNSNTYLSTTRFPTTDRIELLDSVRFAGNIDVRITNVGKADTVYDLTHEPAESAISYRGGITSPLGTPLLENDAATVTFSSSEVTIPAGQSVMVNLQFQEPTTGLPSEFPFYSGYIVATPRIQNTVPARLPYAGVKGDISQVPMLDTKAGFPFFSVVNNQTGEIKNVTAGYKIDFSIEKPQIYTRLGSHTPELSVRLYSDSTGDFVGYLNTPTGIAAGAFGRDKDLGRGGKRYFRTTTWIGGKIYTERNAGAAIDTPEGTYKVVVAAQRKFSQGVYPADFEVYEVAIISVAR